MTGWAKMAAIYAVNEALQFVSTDKNSTWLFSKSLKETNNIVQKH